MKYLGKIFVIGQAMDIGAPAILFLIDAWEGHLTPPEAASIADKVSLWFISRDRKRRSCYKLHHWAFSIQYSRFNSKLWAIIII